MTAAPEKIKFRVTAYNTFTPAGPTPNDRVVARFDVESESLKKALDSAHTIARAWNHNERRPNMIIKHVAALGTVRDVVLPEHLSRMATDVD